MKKIAMFTYPGLHFLFALGTPLWQSRKTLHERKDNPVLAKALAACTYLSSIVSELYLLKSMRKSKKSLFYHILVSPGDALEAITLNVVWMEREFDAHKLSRCMCPSNYNRFSDRARWVENRDFFIPPLHSPPPLGGFPSEYCHPVWYDKN